MCILFYPFDALLKLSFLVFASTTISPKPTRWSGTTSVSQSSEAQSTHCGPAKLRAPGNAIQVCADAILFPWMKKTHLHETNTTEMVLV